MLPPAPALRATLAMADEAGARRVADLLSESLDNAEVVVAVFEKTAGQWDVAMHLSPDVDRNAVRDLVALATDPAVASRLAFETIEAKDWVKESLDGLKPVSAGRFIVHGGHDRERIPVNRIGIEIEAALAFGTGHHGTTRGCLILLDDLLKVRRPRRVLDLGTGTGVLAIAAARALKQSVLASDIDRRSAITARQNAELNRTRALVRAIRASGFNAPEFSRRGPFDLVMANILANPLKRLAKPMAAHLAPRATVILSGLLPPHANGVISAYRACGLILQKKIVLDGWVSLLLRG